MGLNHNSPETIQMKFGYSLSLGDRDDLSALSLPGELVEVGGKGSRGRLEVVVVVIKWVVVVNI